MGPVSSLFDIVVFYYYGLFSQLEMLRTFKQYGSLTV